MVATPVDNRWSDNSEAWRGPEEYGIRFIRKWNNAVSKEFFACA
jgi:hypothetical protein